MALTSASTYQNAVDQLNDNLLWDGDAAKAANFVEAGRWLLAQRPQQGQQGDVRNQYDTQWLADEVRRASQYISRTGTRGCSFTHARPIVL